MVAQRIVDWFLLEKRKSYIQESVLDRGLETISVLMTSTKAVVVKLDKRRQILEKSKIQNLQDLATDYKQKARA